MHSIQGRKRTVGVVEPRLFQRQLPQNE